MSKFEVTLVLIKEEFIFFQSSQETKKSYYSKSSKKIFSHDVNIKKKLDGESRLKSQRY